jgi:hypothetical protein
MIRKQRSDPSEVLEPSTMTTGKPNFYNESYERQNYLSWIYAPYILDSRQEIRNYASAKRLWDIVGEITRTVDTRLSETR